MPEVAQSAAAILRALFGLGALTLLMAAWQAATRGPAMKKAGIELQKGAHVSDLDALLPSSARRVNDNYNHLLEAPTVFYAVALAIVVAGLATPFYAVCAWCYLGCRIAHSLVQATFNRVAVRAAIYALSWLALAPMIIGPLLTL